MNKLNENPYRVFFPAGLLLGFWGAALWILFFAGKIAYPGTSHPDIMMGGFLLCFATGFLLTAAPKFTASFPMTTIEEWTFFALLAAQVLGSFLFERTVFFALALLLLISLAAFLIRRFRRRTVTPPASFIFIGAGILLTTLSLLGMLLQTVCALPEYITSFSREYFYQGFILFMVIGIGTKLIPMLTGHETGATSPRTSRLLTPLLALFVLTFALAPLVPKIAVVSRGLLVFFIFAFYWKILIFPKKKTRQSWGLWISSWMMAAGVLLSGLFSAYRVHFLHLYFIGGLGLLTLMVATRVTLAHGGHGFELETRSKVLPLVTALILFSAVSRVAAGFANGSYLEHLLYAAGLWCAALALWGFVFIPRILKPNSP